jgi:hypothetical protein
MVQHPASAATFENADFEIDQGPTREWRDVDLPVRAIA